MMAEMKRPQRNYNLIFAFFSAVIGMWLFAGMLSGQIFFWLPQGNLGLLRYATEAQIMNVQLLEEVTAVDFSEPGNYRIISNNPRIHASNLSLRSAATNEEVSKTVLDRTFYEPYDDDLLKGVPLIDFQIKEPGRYEIMVSNLAVNIVKPIITVFPEYTSQNRLRLLGTGAVFLTIFLVVLGVFWFRSKQLDVPKEQRSQKRDKWTAFMDENE